MSTNLVWNRQLSYNYRIYVQDYTSKMQTDISILSIHLMEFMAK